jgi:hypothetical protein
MKNFCQRLKLVLALEKDDQNNPTGMQIRVWKVNNGTTILIRMFAHIATATKILWDGKRNGREVDDLILSLLKSKGVIVAENNWDYSTEDEISFQNQDEYEEKEKCHYFSWSVKKELLRF